MKKFIYSLLAFSVLVLLLYNLISYAVKPINVISSDYTAALIDKHNRITKLKVPKIIFAGGSNLAFGINSELLEKEFSVPVVNLGLHAGLGLNFILNELKSVINKGDVVFLSIEFFMDPDGTYSLKRNTSNYFKEANNYYNYDVREEIMLDIDKTRSNIKLYNSENPSFNSNTDGDVYLRKSFNKYGDVIGHLDRTPPKELIDYDVIYKGRWKGIDKLNEFYKYAESKNVSVFFLYPNFAENEYRKKGDAVKRLSIDLSNFLNIPILNKPTDFVYADSLFYDTVYHLNKNGREIRTKKLIEVIKSNSLAIQKINSIKATF